MRTPASRPSPTTRTTKRHGSEGRVNGNSTTYVRDGFGEVIGQTSPDSGATVYRFDGDGNLTQKVGCG